MTIRLADKPIVATDRTEIIEDAPTEHENPDRLQTLMALLQMLHYQGVRYCHWKSNIRLEQALAGKTDLDLLVDRRHAQLFRQVLDAYDVKPILAAPGKSYPGVENYLGFDRPSGEFFHLHVHYQLVLGEQFVKNYRLPLEGELLDSVRLLYDVQAPAPEWEIIVLAMRALLKYRDRDAVKDVLSVRTSGLPVAVLEEVQWLLAQTTMARVAETVSQVADIVPADAVMAFLQTVSVAPRSGYDFYLLRSEIRQGLRPYERRGRFSASAAYYGEMGRRSRRLSRFFPSQKATSVAGGQTVALIGADGAGKSTMCSAIFEWLSWKLDVKLYYLGSKEPSRRSERIYKLFRMARRSHRTASNATGENSALARMTAGLRQLLLYSHHLSIGHDRYARYLEGRQQAANGSLVIYDRYPLEAPLDGPKIHLDAGEHMSPLARLFSRLERNLYGRFKSPDCLIVLDVSPDVSLRRKPDHDRDAIEQKSRLVRRLLTQTTEHTARSALYRIDADQPLEEVLDQLKATLWALL